MIDHIYVLSDQCGDEIRLTHRCSFKRKIIITIICSPRQDLGTLWKVQTRQGIHLLTGVRTI